MQVVQNFMRTQKWVAFSNTGQQDNSIVLWDALHNVVQHKVHRPSDLQNTVRRIHHACHAAGPHLQVFVFLPWMLFNQQFRHDFVEVKLHNRTMCPPKKLNFILCPLPNTHLIFRVIAEHIVASFTAESGVVLLGNCVQKSIKVIQSISRIHSSAPVIAIR